MQVRLKQKVFGVAAAVVLGLATIGATTLPASARGGGGHGGGAFVGGGGGGFHGGGGFSGGAFHSGAGFAGGAIGRQHFAGGGNFYGDGIHGYRRHNAHFGDYYGYYNGYYDCGSPYALLNPYVCSYPNGYY